MSCNKNQLPRPVRGNAFNIAVKVIARRLDGTVIYDFELSQEDVLNIVYRGTLTPTAFTIDAGNVALIHFDGTQAVGMYGVDFSGVFEGEPWRFALPIIFQVVDQTSQGWLPKDGIIVDPTYEVVASVTFATVGGSAVVQADWAVTNPDNPAYIKNKPSVYTQQQIDAKVAQESQARQQADTTLDGKITANTNAIAAEKSRAEAAEHGLQTAIGSEATRAQQAEHGLQTAIGAEETRARGAEQGLQTAIGAEETRARGAEQGLQTAIGAEETRAKAAEQQNADDIDGIEAVIPAQASAQNQLADKNFVNSSISTNTANFVGTYNSLSELQAVQNPTNNDYGFVIEQDAAGNEYYDRYKYVASSQQWLFEYKVESTPFTAAQWAAIQSGITSALVTKLSALPTNAELQQALTLINNTLAGKANSADLAAVATSGSYNDLSDKPTIPTALSQLSQDSTHRVVSDTEKSTWNGKQDSLVSGTNIKTINNESILGSGNISISGGGGYTQTVVSGASITQTLSPNVFYSFGTVTSLTATLDTPVSGMTNEYTFEFDSGSTPTTLSLPAAVQGIDATTIQANKHYEVSIKYDASNQNYYGLIQEW